ncbi:MCE family protein [Nocardia yunnanensis]|uniref:MCE family protein n=1 Tax=Nocardia yunnanensis TaxID=2382165 RepID=A0A386ZEB3_9NOCA|nr:MlaD family protein [Nocardia yunnanensis]AYF74829.1 MCE family protein [Nocardia yunnanensis]
MKRVLGSQGFVTAVGVTVAVLIAVVAYLIAFDPLKKTYGYCAIMPDAVGLYPGNHVTMLGIPVGTVRSLHAEGARVRVDFTLEAGHPLHGDVMATTVSDTLLADRDLEVLGDNSSRVDWIRSRCIAKTFTPKSITETLRAFTGLADQLGGSGDPAESSRVRDAVSAFERATSDTGPQLNQLIKDLGTALRQPDAAIGHLGDLIDAFASLAASVSINWADIKHTVTDFAPGLTLVNEVWASAVQLLNGLLVDFPMFNNISHKYGREILDGLDEIIPYLKLLAANIGTLKKIIDMIPALADAFGQVVDPDTGRVRITYAAPKVGLPPGLADQVCAAVDAARPGQCRSADGLATVNLVPLVLGLAGAR